jgi:8-oxo-dGTP pyrophosphatase MutT (NUDIX family)
MPDAPVDPFAGDGVPVAVPAASVVPLRDGPGGPETLLVRRDKSLAFAGGLWVWPGGRIDDGDHVGAPGSAPGSASASASGSASGSDALADLEAAARAAAVREASEEAGLALAANDLVWFAHFIPPPDTTRRYSTFFFATGVAGDTEVVPDGSEVHEYRWLTPADALEACRDRELGLLPPTWILLEMLAPFASVDEALGSLGARDPEFFATRFAAVEEGAVALFAGDAGYETGDPQAPGARHRLWTLRSGWRYERSS